MNFAVRVMNWANLLLTGQLVSEPMKYQYESLIWVIYMTHMWLLFLIKILLLTLTLRAEFENCFTISAIEINKTLVIFDGILHNSSGHFESFARVLHKQSFDYQCGFIEVLINDTSTEWETSLTKMFTGYFRFSNWRFVENTDERQSLLR